jgi:hypothetical protein
VLDCVCDRCARDERTDEGHEDGAEAVACQVTASMAPDAVASAAVMAVSVTTSMLMIMAAVLLTKRQMLAFGCTFDALRVPVSNLVTSRCSDENSSYSNPLVVDRRHSLP